MYPNGLVVYFMVYTHTFGMLAGRSKASPCAYTGSLEASLLGNAIKISYAVSY